MARVAQISSGRRASDTTAWPARLGLGANTDDQRYPNRVSRLLAAPLVQRVMGPVRYQLRTHTARISRRQVELLREQLGVRLDRIVADVGDVARRNLVQAANLAAAVRHIESLTAELRTTRAGAEQTAQQLAATRRQLTDTRRQLAVVRKQVAESRKQPAARPTRPSSR